MKPSSSRTRLVASGVIPFGLVVVLVAYVAGFGPDLLELGVSLPEVTIEKVDFVDSEIQATVRNTGPMPVQVVMADVNDRIHPAAVEPDGYLERYETALVRIPFEWNAAEPYVIGVTTSDGTRFPKGDRGGGSGTGAYCGPCGAFWRDWNLCRNNTCDDRTDVAPVHTADLKGEVPLLSGTHGGTLAVSGP